MSKQWFHSWFNSPYYHLLYNQRNATEAEQFISKLHKHLNLQAGARLLDVGCGRGRHSCLLHKMGYQVTGIDLSVGNVEYAMQYETVGLQFFAHDMRSLYYQNYFAAAFNLFTSFGYFNSHEQHIKVLTNIYQALLPGGLLVLDYLNSNLVTSRIKPVETKTIGGVTFALLKQIKDNKVLKRITINDDSKVTTFEEQVALFTADEFKSLFKQSRFEIVKIFGSYQLDDFDERTSDRLIFICKKQ